MIQNIFFDRDGTLGELDDVRYPQTLRFFPDSKTVISRLKERGYRVFIATNQSCIARGTDGGYNYEQEFGDLGVDDWFICPHDKNDGCSCRKPKPGLLEQAIQKYGLKREECLMVGDRETDVECALNAGIHAALLCISGSVPREGTKAEYVLYSLSDLLSLLET